MTKALLVLSAVCASVAAVGWLLKRLGKTLISTSVEQDDDELAPEYPYAPGFKPRLDGRYSAEQFERQARYWAWCADNTDDPAERTRLRAWADVDSARAERLRREQG